MPGKLALAALLLGAWPASGAPPVVEGAAQRDLVVAAAGVLERGQARADGDGAPLLVAAAANLRPALDVLLPAFTAAGGGPVQAVYGASGTFYAQLSAGAPFDLFLSAEGEYPARLAAEGRAVPGTEFRYAVGRLALYARAGSPVDPARGLEGLARPGVGKVAIASPALAPYGRAAEAALAAAGVAAEVTPRLVVGESAQQAAQFAASSACDAGLIPLALARAPALAAAGRYALVPAALHPPILQAGVVLAASARPARARALAAFLRTPAARAALARAGFEPPG